MSNWQYIECVFRQTRKYAFCWKLLGTDTHTGQVIPYVWRSVWIIKALHNELLTIRLGNYINLLALFLFGVCCSCIKRRLAAGCIVCHSRQHDTLFFRLNFKMWHFYVVPQDALPRTTLSKYFVAVAMRSVLCSPRPCCCGTPPLIEYGTGSFHIACLRINFSVRAVSSWN